jgi:hypothetical protein
MPGKGATHAELIILCNIIGAPSLYWNGTGYTRELPECFDRWHR